MTHWDAESRRDAFEKGHALPPDSEDGEPRYPIEACDDVKNAVEDYRRGPGGGERERAFITRRAVDLGCTQHLPEDWRLVQVEGRDDEENDGE